jgi:NTE family protein
MAGDLDRGPDTAPSAPVVGEEPAGKLEDGIGIALSGGGYRAMLFHTGAIVRLFEAGLLQRAARISSVSGGSIVSAKLGLEWPHLADRDALFARVVDPVRRMADIGIDVSSVLGGLVLPGGVGHRVSEAFARHLFGGATLQDLPENPTFVINATNVETGKLWRFSRARARDWTLGEIASPRFALADAVAASSSFPPILSPFVLDTRPSDFTSVEAGVDPAFLDDITLTDGGVYDNLGLETIKGFPIQLVSDGGRGIEPEPAPRRDWARHGLRILGTIDNQVRSLRKRALVASYEKGERQGCYWAVRSDAGRYPAAEDPLGTRQRDPTPLAALPTRLAALERSVQDRLINWGYAISDLALRSHVSPELARSLGLDLTAPAGFPLPGGY